ncbi:unnamed protein product [Paramecium pentaurelia]|uniref:Uncharacterized protein n=1 Tax=Paramecium pentaurelia TaxID=43138 RepID=A0A8S1S2F1_9CILI|nr:unnamed protein product [Paramecium pentaurelia]
MIVIADLQNNHIVIQHKRCEDFVASSGKCLDTCTKNFQNNFLCTKNFQNNFFVEGFNLAIVIILNIVQMLQLLMNNAMKYYQRKKCLSFF